MKFATYLNLQDEKRAGFFIDNELYDLKDSATKAGIELPSDMLSFLRESDVNYSKARDLEQIIKNSNEFQSVEPVKLLSPIPNPPSVRDGYAFRQHVAAARKNRGVDMIPEFDQYPIFYFTNHTAVFGEGDIIVEKDHLEKCDFELEWAAVIGKSGKNIQSSEADDYIFGYTIFNDFSARLLQMEEMKLNLGPAKGKDFASSFGPILITKDELQEVSVPTEFGMNYNLEMKAYHNGEQISSGNTKDMNWTFAEIIERASYGVELQPGDIIGSGTVGTGCYLELNGTRAREAKERGDDYTPVWLKSGDDITLEIEKIGILKNRIVLSDNNVSILAKKKNG